MPNDSFALRQFAQNDVNKQKQLNDEREALKKEKEQYIPIFQVVMVIIQLLY